MTSRLNILAFSFFPAFLPPRNGGVERLYRIYAALAERHDVTLISSGEVAADLESVTHGPSFREIRVGKKHLFAQAYGELSAVAGDGDLSGPAVGMSCMQDEELIAQYCAAYPAADVIIHDSPFLIECDLFRGIDGKPRVYNSYNVEADLYASFHNAADAGRTIESLVARLEAELVATADLVTACSSADAERFSDRYQRADVVLVPNGVVAAASSRRDPPANRKKLIFVGSNHLPNREAASLIVDEIAPANPNFEFHLIGSCAEAFETDNVVSHGMVDAPEKQRLFRESTAAINPITSGGGSSLKIADLAMQQVPILSTALGVRGYAFDEGVHFLEVGAGNFATDLAGLVEDEDKLAAIASEALSRVREQYTWDKIVVDFDDLLRGLVAKRSQAGLFLVLNDYPSLSSVGGGSTRTTGLCVGLAETRPVVFLSFHDHSNLVRTSLADGRILALAVPKTAEHVAAHERDQAEHFISTADITSFAMAPRNPQLRAIFEAAASLADHIICEHCYMVSLPKRLGARFVYSAQNFEYRLKEQLFADHPRKDDLVGQVFAIEEYACGAADLIVAVSQSDAANLSAAYAATAPIVVIRNGSEVVAAAEDDGDMAEPRETGRQMSALFIGSSHLPNVEAAKHIAGEIAPSLPHVTFHVIGSVCDTVPEPLPANVSLLGQLSEAEKARAMRRADLAINPMLSGSGSNIKVADCLQHGLPVLATSFGARGYEDVRPEDLETIDLADFPARIEAFAKRDTATRDLERRERQSLYRRSLSMVEGGRRLNGYLSRIEKAQRRALYVTYRYTEPPMGGGELHMCRLVQALADSGWFIDIVAPAADRITDEGRFAAHFSASGPLPTPIGHPTIRVTRLPLGEATPPSDITRLWALQPAFERTVFEELASPARSGLTFGWGGLEPGGRWAFRDCGIAAGNKGRLRIVGHAPQLLWMELLDRDENLVHQFEAKGNFVLECPIEEGALSVRLRTRSPLALPDVRPLAMFVSDIAIDDEALIDRALVPLLADEAEPAELIAALARARKKIRDPARATLTDLRQPAPDLAPLLAEIMPGYDLLLTHNAVFGTATTALAAAQDAGVPSLFLPHLHLDDDFYHFSDIDHACRIASRTLVCPQVAVDLLRSEGLENVAYHAPGLDTSTTFTQADSKAFRDLLGHDGAFFLVLGRKAAAKGYRDVIKAVESLQRDDVSVVLIGPDDDREPIDSKVATYLDRQPDPVVRGALRECIAVINLSRSESFGMVLLEAGLAAKPVIANRRCAAFAELVEDGRNGFLIDAEHLATPMRKLIDDPRLRESMGTEGRKRALNHDWSMIERDFVSECNSLVESRQ